MSQILSNPVSDRLRLWTYVEAELLKGNAFLLPLRLFIGLGWLRAGVEKMIDPAWRAGDAVSVFFQVQMAVGAVHFPFYETLMTQFFEPNALVLSWIILIGELLAGIAILTGTLTNLALLGGLFMNLNFVLAGVVNPSAFYIVIQGALLSGNAGATLGVDSILNHRPRAVGVARSSSPADGNSSWKKWALLVGCVLCGFSATLVVPYIRDFGPHSVDDPAMLLFILLMLGTMLLGIHFMRMSTEKSEA